MLQLVLARWSTSVLQLPWQGHAALRSHQHLLSLKLPGGWSLRDQTAQASPRSLLLSLWQQNPTAEVGELPSYSCLYCPAVRQVEC